MVPPSGSEASLECAVPLGREYGLYLPRDLVLESCLLGFCQCSWEENTCLDPLLLLQVSVLSCRLEVNPLQISRTPAHL